MTGQLEADVALLTEQRYTASVASQGDWYLANILNDDGLLQSALSRRGLSSVRVDWADPLVDWSSFRCAVFRTTWDYYERLPEFMEWLARVERQTRLCNSPSTVRWNSDKHYLADLAACGIPVVPSRFVERGSTATLLELLDETGWREAVIKPCVSGTARHTYRVEPRTAGDVDAKVRELLAAESLILQPFQQDIVDRGEDSLMVINGRFTHAVRKVPKAGDFRVQDDHGGTAYPYQPTEDQIELAERAVAACKHPASYGRVDLVRDNLGAHAVMELELIEPELWLRNHPPAASALAETISQVATGRD